MKPFLSLLPFLAATTMAWALPADLTDPPTTFGDADRDGTLLVSKELREADFGNGLRLPVRWVFRSKDQGASSYGWAGFSLTLLQSKAVRQNASVYEVTLLCGKTLYFGPNTVSGNAPVGGSGNSNGGLGASSGAPQWQSNDKQWTGFEDTAHGKFTITRWDGWQLEYKDGRISKLKTDDNRTLQWSYDATDPSLATAIAEVGHNAVIQVGISDTLTQMEGASATRGAHSLTVNGDTYLFSYENGSLHEIQFPDSRKITWKFEFVSADKKLTLTREDGSWSSWTYATGSFPLLIRDDVWEYSFQNTYVSPTPSSPSSSPSPSPSPNTSDGSNSTAGLSFTGSAI